MIDDKEPGDADFSESGQPIYRHRPRISGEPPATGDSHMRQISDHIERQLGPIKFVLDEVGSEFVHLDVHYVAPSDARPWTTLVTSGMSDRPMQVPDELSDFAYSELMINLPASWPIDIEQFEDESIYWPIRLLKTLARFPHRYETWLGYGHTVPHGDPPTPYDPSTGFCCALLGFPQSAGEDFFSLSVRDDKVIRFWSLVPLYREELDYKLRYGTDALEDLFAEQSVGDLVDVDRANVALGGD